MFRLSQEERRKPVKLDVRDKKILILLSENARMSLSTIAKKVHLSRDTVHYRIRRMEKLGVIIRYFPELDFKKIGYNVYHLFLLIDETDQVARAALIETMKNHPNTLSLIEYSDRWDFEWIVAAKNIEEFDMVVTDLHAKFSNVITERNKLLVIHPYFTTVLLYETNKEKNKPFIKETKEIHYRPDKKDLEIVEALTEDCRTSTYDIAKEVNLSPDAIGLRIKKLVQSGIIKRFTILPNFSLLGCNWYTFVIQMKTFEKKNELRFKSFVRNNPHIIGAVKTLGAWDLLTYIITNNDSREFHYTIKQIKHAFAATIKHYDTFIAYKEHIFNPIPQIIINHHKE